MAVEFETKVLDVDVGAVESALAQAGATLQFDSVFRRWLVSFDADGKERLRVREENGKAKLTFKRQRGTGADQTEEYEVEVSSFQQAAQIVKRIPAANRVYLENRRVQYRLDDLTFCLDTYPFIPTYLEVESDSMDRVQAGLRLLGLEGKDVGHLSMEQVAAKYGVNPYSRLEWTLPENRKK